jgi:hypothetical protein
MNRIYRYGFLLIVITVGTSIATYNDYGILFGVVVGIISSVLYVLIEKSILRLTQGSPQEDEQNV